MTSLPQDDAWPEFTVFLESIPAPAFVTAPDGRIVSANTAATALWGRSPTVRDNCCFDIIWLADDGSPAGHEACPVAAALARRQSTSVGRGRLARAGQPTLTLECSSAPLRDASGALRGVVSLIRPFSGAEAGDQRLRVAIEAARLGYWSLDITTGVVTASPQFRTNLGLPPDHQLRFEEDVVRPTRDRYQQALRQRVADAIATQGTFQIEVPRQHLNERDHWLLIAGRAIDATCMVGVSLDITDRKVAEHRIADINRRKDEFIATLGHELRQPLAPMALALTLLRSDPAPEVSRRAHDNLARQLEHLTRLVDDLVDSARVAQGKITLLLELITLQDALSNAANVAAPEMSQKRLHFDLEMPPEPVYVMADGSRLQQVFSNLLLNAAKFTDPGGRVRVRLRQEGDVSIIQVRDTGRGVAPEMRAKLFDMFMQADTTTGLGIGLPIVKRLVELHGGTVVVTFTSPGAGSEFTVTLPVASVAGRLDRLGS